MNFVLDMNIPKGWVEFLQTLGHRAIHWRDIGNICAEDTEIMQWARINQFIVFTHDLDFGSLLYATQANKPSVIQLRMESIIPSIAGEIVNETIELISKELEQGALVIIDPKKHRVRVLPLGK
ncbi:DUF5615 family PIN-like protein [Sulfurimonas sp. MAG313]|nr:DUF5615 family PIN-like protein [Sulfurimonas sp. MAG313]MDF1882275.1 DUF5615 family PIN-like protein [Sulfurimonas sp. MAG313]